MVRLRKMGLPEFDVSSERLQLRPNLEEALDDIFRHHSFRRVVDFAAPTLHKIIKDGDPSCTKDTADKTKEDRTSWNRSIWLYQRVSE